MVLAVTGHRPERLGGYSPGLETQLREFLSPILQGLSPDQVITGMALGFDQAIGWVCSSLKIPFIAAVPFEDYEAIWPEHTKSRYRDLLSRACEVVMVSQPGYATWKLHARNRWMVSHSDKLLALCDGSIGSGTIQCRKYAERMGVPVVNIWAEWEMHEKVGKCLDKRSVL